MGELGLLRGLFGGEPGDPPRDAAAMQLCLLRETLAEVDTEAETALALQGLGSYPILQSGSDAPPRPLAPRRRLRRRRRRVRALRARRRLRRRRAHPRGRARTATAGPSTARRPGSPTPLTPTSTPSSPGPPPATARGASPRSRSPGDSRGPDRRAARHARPARPRPLVFDGVRVTPRRRPRRGRPGVRGRDAHPRPVPPERRRVRGRHGPGGPRREHRLGAASGAVRAAG